MQPFFDFLSEYWWLAFPLMAGMGGVGTAWERSARRRHRRRLEILRAKSEVRQAKAVSPTRADDGPVREDTSVTDVQRLLDAHDGVTARWLDYELDVAKLIAFPAMSDGRQPLTAAFLRAKHVADRARPDSARARLSREQLAEYRAAVTDYEVAFDLAERDARRIKDSGFTTTERKRLDVAKQLITVAVDEAATPAERQLAYKRVREELDGLISLSDDAIDVLENKVMLELTESPAEVDGAPAEVDGTPEPQRSPSREPKTGPWPAPARSSSSPGRVVRPKPHH